MFHGPGGSFFKKRPLVAEGIKNGARRSRTAISALRRLRSPIKPWPRLVLFLPDISGLHTYVKFCSRLLNYL